MKKALALVISFTVSALGGAFFASSPVVAQDAPVVVKAMPLEAVIYTVPSKTQTGVVTPGYTLTVLARTPCTVVESKGDDVTLACPGIKRTDGQPRGTATTVRVVVAIKAIVWAGR